MIITWSDSAKLAYEELIDELVDEWEIGVAENLENKIIELEERLKRNKNLCPESKQKKLRKCVVHKLTSLVYRIVDPNNIEVVGLIQNRMSNQF